jgi:hypothetical protein
MPRFAPLLVVLVTLLAGCNNNEDPTGATPTPGTPTPPPPPEPPTEGSVVARVNDTWSYRGDRNETVTSSVTGVNASIVRLRTVSQRLNATPHTTVTLFDARTLAVVSVQDDTIGATIRFEPPLPIIIPAEDHEYNGTLVVASPFGDLRQPAVGSVRFLGPETITVPAGEFYTYRYNASVRSEGLFPFEQSTDLWFSPEVEQSVKSIRDGRLQELVSFDVLD